MRTATTKDTRTPATPAKKAAIQRKPQDAGKAEAQRAEIRSILDGVPLQEKLRVGAPDDAYEREADHVADRVVAGEPAPSISRITSPVSEAQPQASDNEELLQAKSDDELEEEELIEPKLLQRQTDDEENEELLQPKLIQREVDELGDEEEIIQSESRSKVQRKTSGIVASTRRAIDSGSGGRPMNPATRSTLESSMGVDLGGVRVHEDSTADQAAWALNARAFTHGNNIWLGEGESQTDTKLMAHEATHVVQQQSGLVQRVLQRAEGKSEGKIIQTKPSSGQIPSLIQRQAQQTSSNLQRLDQMLGQFNVPEEDVISLLGNLSADERTTVLSGGYKSRIASALNVEEMVRAVKNLQPSLVIQLEWVKAAALMAVMVDYADIKSLITQATQPERDALKTTAWRDFFVNVCTNETMVVALNDLEFDLGTKLSWLKAEMTITSWELDYETIRPWIIDAPSQGERDALKTTAWRDFFVDVCTNETMVVALNDLEFDLGTKLSWLKAEMTITSWELDYETIRPWIIDAASQGERDALKTTAWRDFFVDVCTNETMVVALNDLEFDLETKLSWLNAEMTITSWELDYAAIRPWIIPPTPQGERDALKTTAWRDFFVDICTEVTIINAVTDLVFDPPTQFEWVRVKGGLALTTQMFASWSASDILGILSGLSDSDFDSLMSAMNQTQTQDLLGKITPADIAAHGALIVRIQTARLLVTAESMLGELRWRGGSGPDSGSGYQVSETTAWGHPNDFAKWIRGTGPEPTSTSTMNCWEGVLFMAYKAGIVTKGWLVSIHTAAATAGSAAGSTSAYYTVLESRLYSGPRSTFTYDHVSGVGSPDVPAGNIIFVNGIDHVMLSKGTKDPNGKHEVISLWVFPSPGRPAGGFTGSEEGVIQSTTIEEVLVTGGLTAATVKFAAAPW